MDPVNPAPAGNPQLTTHLLVSHKKNKNFHPSKVSLKRVNILTKEVPLLCRPVPHIMRFMAAQKWRFVRQKGQLRVAGILPEQKSRSTWLSWGIDDQPCTIVLDIRWTETIKIEHEAEADDEDGEPSIEYTFKGLTFALEILDWDDVLLIHLTESDVYPEVFDSEFQVWVNCWHQSSDIPLANSLSFKISWNDVTIKIGDSQTYNTPHDEPSDSLSKSNADFVEMNSSLIRVFKFMDFLLSEDGELKTHGRSNLFRTVTSPQIRL